MEASRHAVLKVVRFTGVGVGQVADVALERGVAKEGLEAGEFGGIV